MMRNKQGYECGIDGEPCEADSCTECCPHDERDHGVCLDCGDEDDGSSAIDDAHDSMDMER